MSSAESEDIAYLLNHTRVWAIVGLGTDQSRPAYSVAQFLQSKGKEIIAIHPRALSVLDAPAYRTLTEASAHHDIDVVDCFVNASRVGDIIDEAIALRLPAVWMQLGIVDILAHDRARAQGLRVVMDRCPAIEWSTYV